jgi:hypothetical protein
VRKAAVLVLLRRGICGVYHKGFLGCHDECMKLLDCLRLEVFTAVTMKNAVFWDVMPCGSCKNRRFGGTWRLLHQGDTNR